MSVMLLLILALVSMQPVWPETPSWLDVYLGPAGPLWATMGCLALVWTVGSVSTWYYCRAIRRDPGRARRILGRFHSRQQTYFLLLIFAFLGTLYFLGWGRFVSDIFYDEKQVAYWPGRPVVLLAPLLIGLACSWARFYDAERTVHRTEMLFRSPLPALETTPGPTPFLSRLAYLKLQVRFNLLLSVLPMLLMLILEILIWTIPGLRTSREEFETGFFMLFLLAALVGMPWILRMFLGLKPLPEGPLRDRLEATSRRLKLRCSAILLWNTRNSSANAMVTGILPWPRYIVLTDQLLRELSVEEVEAVIGHEIGHVKHHHMFYYMMFLLGSLMSLDLIWVLCKMFLKSNDALTLVKDWAPMLQPWLENLELVTAFPPLLGVSLYLFLVFGYLSRCCETQADIFGSRAISNEVFISALEKVAALNGIPRDKPGWLSSWRHPTIASRVDFLRRMGEQPDLEPRFQRRIGLFKWSLALGLAVVLTSLWIFVPQQEPDRKSNSAGEKPAASLNGKARPG